MKEWCICGAHSNDTHCHNVSWVFEQLNKEKNDKTYLPKYCSVCGANTSFTHCLHTQEEIEARKRKNQNLNEGALDIVADIISKVNENKVVQTEIQPEICRINGELVYGNTIAYKIIVKR